MKTVKFYSFTLLLLLLSLYLDGQNIATVIGPDIGINDAIVMTSNGDIYGSDHEGHDVYKYTHSGDIYSIASFETHPNGMVLDENDNLYVTIPQSHQIYIITPDEEVELFCDIPNPNGIIFQKGTDTLLVTSYPLNQIRKVAPNGEFSIWIESDLLDGPLGLCYDDNDVLYVSNFNNGDVFKIIDNELEYFATVPGDDVFGEYYSIGYIAYLDHYIYATGFGKNKIYRIDPEGNTHFFAGSGNTGTNDGDANSADFYFPNGILPSITGDSIYVTDYQTHSLRVITEIPVSVAESEPNISDIKLSPNPGSSFLQFQSQYPVKKFQLYNISGELLYSESFSNGTIQDKIDLTSYKPGIYFISFLTDSDKIQKVFIKK